MKGIETFSARLKPKEARSHLVFLCICLLILATAWIDINAWMQMSRGGDQSSTLWIIPLISAFLLYDRRSTVFAETQSKPAGLMLLAAGIGVCLASRSPLLALGPMDTTSLAMLGVLISVAGSFLTCYGFGAWRKAMFPLGFLLFAVPIPQGLLDPLVRWLQCGSAAMVSILFKLLSVPHLRDGLRFYLAGLNIEIASECSGIRSSFALLVLTVLLSYITLNSTWRRLVLVSAVVPLVLVKNAIRIVTLALLSIRVDHSFIDGPLHHRGGFVFFGLALAAEGLLCWLLYRSELNRPVSPE